MAIDDNTIYGLTGAQVKDLAQRIQSGGGGGGGTAIDLSQDLFNWNSSTQTTTNPDSIALWLLDPGCYSLSDISVPVYSDYYNAIQQESLIWVFPAQVITGYIGIMVKNTNSREIIYRVFDPSIGSLVTVATFSDVDMTLLSVKTNIIQTDSNAAPTSTDYASRGQVWVYVDTDDVPHLYVSAGTDWSLPTPENTWIELQSGGGSGLITLSYGISTWQDFIDAYNAGEIVYCRASSNSNPATGAQTRMAFMAYINDPATPTEVEFQYVRSVASKTAAQPCDQVFIYTLTPTNGGTWAVESRNVTYKVAAGTNVSTSYSNGTVTINADAPVITMTSTDPGEGGALAANNFIAVYDAN